MSPVSFSNITPGNFELTPCRVTYKGVDLGATLKNVVVKIEDSVAPLKSDQLGDTIIDQKISGFKVTIDTELAETQLKDNWKVVFPTHKLVVNGPNKIFYFDSTVGVSLLSFAGQLVLHPLSRPNSDLSGDILIYLATAEGKSEYHLSATEQNTLKLTWTIYPDFTTQPARFMLFGDPSVGLQSANAGAATAGTGNVGNDTVSGIAVNNGFTKTETITLKCVTAGGIGVGQFFVSGSLSGALGLAVVGTNFSSNPIAFLVNNGSTPAVVNDTYAIATTAANYS